MKLVLSVKDRLMLQGVLPQSGDLISQTIVKDIQDKIRITQQEMTEGEFRAEKESIMWNPLKVKEVEFDFTNAEVNTLKDAVKKLDEEKKITMENIELCLKINQLNSTKPARPKQEVECTEEHSQQ